MTEYSQIDNDDHDLEFSDFCEQLLFRKFYLVQLYTGSCYELPAIYFFENITDIDNVRYRRDICAISENDSVPKDFKGTVLAIQSEGSHHGHANLYFKDSKDPYMYPSIGPAYTVVLLTKQHVTPGFIKISDRPTSKLILQPGSTYGCTSKCLDNFEGLSRDLVDAVWCPNWPEEAKEWKLRERRNDWPLPHTVNKIIGNGCHLVGKPHQGSTSTANEWRFSFSEAELFLIHSWNEVQMYIYHILRLIKSDVVKKCGGKKEIPLTTYHFKTLMFWSCEEQPKEFWLPENIETSVKTLILVMIEWLVEKQCRNYFIPDNNMIDHISRSHNFENEIQALFESVNLVDQFISKTVAFTADRKADQWKEFSVCVPLNLLYALQIRVSPWYIVDPYRPGRETHMQGNEIGKSPLFRTDISNVFQCLTVHRRLINKECSEKLNGLQEMEKCFRRAYDEAIDGFIYVNFSPMDNFHVIIGKLLRTKVIDESGNVKEPANNRKRVKAITQDGNYVHRESCNTMNKSVERSHVARIFDICLNIMNEQLVKPSCFNTAAHEANFYWTIFGEKEGNAVALESYNKALDICNKWLTYADSIENSFTFKVCFGLQGLPVILSNRWASIFDRYIQVELGFLSLIKAVTRRKLQTRDTWSNSNRDFGVLVQIHATDFLKYIKYQCKFHLNYNFKLDDSFTDNMQNDISRMFLYCAARISNGKAQNTK